MPCGLLFTLAHYLKKRGGGVFHVVYRNYSTANRSVSCTYYGKSWKVKTGLSLTQHYGMVVTAPASQLAGCRFKPQAGHNKDLKNNTYCSCLVRRSALE